MNWKLWLILLSSIIYSIWLLVFRYSMVWNHGKEERFVINRAFIAIALLSLLIPVINIICSIFMPGIYANVKYPDAPGLYFKKRDDLLCKILDWFSKPL